MCTNDFPLLSGDLFIIWSLVVFREWKRHKKCVLRGTKSEEPTILKNTELVLIWLYNNNNNNLKY